MPPGGEVVSRRRSSAAVVVSSSSLLGSSAGPGSAPAGAWEGRGDAARRRWAGDGAAGGCSAPSSMARLGWARECWWWHGGQGAPRWAYSSGGHERPPRGAVCARGVATGQRYAERCCSLGDHRCPRRRAACGARNRRPGYSRRVPWRCPRHGAARTVEGKRAARSKRRAGESPLGCGRGPRWWDLRRGWLHGACWPVWGSPVLAWGRSAGE